MGLGCNNWSSLTTSPPETGVGFCLGRALNSAVDGSSSGPFTSVAATSAVSGRTGLGRRSSTIVCWGRAGTGLSPGLLPGCFVPDAGFAGETAGLTGGLGDVGALLLEPDLPSPPEDPGVSLSWPACSPLDRFKIGRFERLGLLVATAATR